MFAAILFRAATPPGSLIEDGIRTIRPDILASAPQVGIGTSTNIEFSGQGTHYAKFTATHTGSFTFHVEQMERPGSVIMVLYTELGEGINRFFFPLGETGGNVEILHHFQESETIMITLVLQL